MTKSKSHSVLDLEKLRSATQLPKPSGYRILIALPEVEE